VDHLTNDAQQKLREANIMMEKLLRSSSVLSSPHAQIKAVDIASLSNALRQIREEELLVSSVPEDDNLSRERAVYWDSLKKLQAALPVIHIQLKMRLAELSRARAHANAVSGWLNASRDAL
jgi:hypothetical protein